MFQDNITILVIGAHPDDIEIGCGGTLLKLLEENYYIDVHYMTFTYGGIKDEPRIRYEEIRKSLNYLEIESTNHYVFDYEDTNLEKSYPKIIDDIETVTRKTDFQYVITHNPFDPHHDHLTVSKATVEALRKSDCSILMYESISTNNRFKPNFYNILSGKIMERKLELLELFKSQIDKNYEINRDSVLTLAKYRAMQIHNYNYAESFIINKCIML